MLTLITTMLIANSAPGAVDAKLLAPAIIQTARKYRLSPVLLTRIVLVESRGVATAYNVRTQDHGLVQINERTRVAYKISIGCVRNWKCNLDASARILADMLKMGGGRACTYNLGPKGRFSKYQKACLTYESKLDGVGV